MRQPQEAEEAIDFEELVANAAAIFAQIEQRRRRVVVRREGKLYVLRPKGAHRSKRHGFSENDSIFELAGKGVSAEPTDVRHHKDEYLANATSFAVLERLHIREAFSFESDFAQFGFTLVS